LLKTRFENVVGKVPPHSGDTAASACKSACFHLSKSWVDGKRPLGVNVVVKR